MIEKKQAGKAGMIVFALILLASSFDDDKGMIFSTEIKIGLAVALVISVAVKRN